MGDFVTLSCPNCNGKLKVTSDIDRFACAFCGAEHIVKRGDGIISLAPVMDAIGKVQTSVDVIVEDIRLRRESEIRNLEREKRAQARAASEIEIARLTDEIAHIEKQLTQATDKKFKGSVGQLASLAQNEKIFTLVLVIVAIVSMVIMFRHPSYDYDYTHKDEQTNAALACAFSGMVISYLLLRMPFINRSKNKAERRAAELQAALLEKQTEFDRHQEIVDAA